MRFAPGYNGNTSGRSPLLVPRSVSSTSPASAGGETRRKSMFADSSSHDVTRILAELRSGDQSAAEGLLAIVYGELRGLAEAKMRAERADHTLQPTALVHEAFIRLLGDSGGNWENRTHFFGAAAEAMRRILVDYARGKGALKRGAGRNRLQLDEAGAVAATSDDLLGVHEALDQLAKDHPQKAEIVKLRYFVGLTIEEVADIRGVSVRTVNRDWAFAKAWLYREIHGA
jgi:RNA polymerase sigma factor (TIGR02999 family)